MLDLESVLAGLNDAQREAALALRGPVAILAGAGTGKTTTITHRIAWQVRSGAFQPSRILAVTFTDKAAGELKRRLQALGVEGVVRVTQRLQILAQDRIIARVLRSTRPLRPPLFFRLLTRYAVLRRIPGRLIGMGIRPEHIARRA